MPLNHNQDSVPYRVNEPKMVGPFSVTEVAPVAVMGMFGIVLGQSNYFLMSGVLLSLIQIKVRKNFPKGFIIHFLWFHGVMPLTNSKYIPDPIKRRFYQ